MNDTPRNMASELAQYAFERAKAAKDNNMTKYPQYVKKMPAMIRNSGFAKAFAFGYSKDETKGDGKVYGQINSDIREWLKKKGLLDENIEDTKKMIEALIGMDYAKYRRCENETMAFLDWLRRLAEGMMPDETASSGGE